MNDDERESLMNSFRTITKPEFALLHQKNKENSIIFNNMKKSIEDIKTKQDSLSEDIISLRNIYGKLEIHEKRITHLENERTC